MPGHDVDVLRPPLAAIEELVVALASPPVGPDRLAARAGARVRDRSRATDSGSKSSVTAADGPMNFVTSSGTARTTVGSSFPQAEMAASMVAVPRIFPAPTLASLVTCVVG
jgi:hypothetical protein